MRTTIVLFSTAVVILASARASHAASTIEHAVLGSGGGVTTSSQIAAFTVIGDPLAGRAVGTVHTIESGFLACLGATGVTSTPPAELPAISRLQWVAPNPARSNVTIAFDVAREEAVSLRVFDTSGRLVRVVTEARYLPGHFTVAWDGRAVDGRLVQAGVYYCQFRSGQVEQTRRVILIR